MPSPHFLLSILLEGSAYNSPHQQSHQSSVSSKYNSGRPLQPCEHSTPHSIVRLAHRTQLLPPPLAPSHNATLHACYLNHQESPRGHHARPASPQVGYKFKPGLPDFVASPFLGIQTLELARKSGTCGEAIYFSWREDDNGSHIWGLTEFRMARLEWLRVFPYEVRGRFV